MFLKNRIAGILILFLACFAVPALAGKAPVTAGIVLTYEYAGQGNVTSVVLKGSDSQPIGTALWNGKLPLGWDSRMRSYYVPTLVLAILRDKALQSSHPESFEAADWMALLMDDYGLWPVEEISEDLISTINAARTKCACGNLLDTVQNLPVCKGTCTTGKAPACSGCVCSRCTTTK